MIGSKLFELTGKVALITGATHGIGLALARGLAQAGARVVINARNAEKLARAVATLRRRAWLSPAVVSICSTAPRFESGSRRWSRKSVGLTSW